MTTLGLKNVNMLSKEQYNGIAEPATDELYAISGAGFGLPSDRFIDLTLGASGATYTAPANGWVYVNKQGDANQFFNLTNPTKNYGVNEITSSSPFGLLIMLPVSKGDVFRIDYNLNGTTNVFRFIYAEGEE